MSNLSSQQERESFRKLEEEFRKLKSKYVRKQSPKDELKYTGNASGRTAVIKAKEMLNEAVSFIKKEYRELDNKLKKKFPDAYKYAESLPDKGKALAQEAYGMVGTVVKEADMYIYQKNPELYNAVSSTLQNAPQKISEQGRSAITYLENATKRLDSELSRRYPLIWKDIKKEIKKQAHEIQVDGIYHPWGGAEYRKAIGALLGVEKEVNNLYELSLASLLHSKTVALKGEFIDLLRKDPAIKKVNDNIRLKIINEIKIKKQGSTNKMLTFGDDGRGYKGIGLGGKRHPDNMLKQLRNILNFDKYKATWDVGLNKLTWSLRNGIVNYDYKWYCVYNKVGYAFVWEVKYIIKDKLDLRPRSSRNFDFRTPYNIATSILGAAYHDIIGASDTLTVTAEWNSTFAEEPTRW